MKIGQHQQSLPPRWEEFLNALTHQLAKPAFPLLSTRCITRSDLSKIFVEIRKELSLPSTFPDGPDIIQHLHSMGLVSVIPVDLTGNSPESSPSKQFIVFGIEGTSKPDIDSLELLQAYNQDGVICYFSAISYFDLTTQAPAHHHIASLTRKSPIKKLSRQDLVTNIYTKERTTKNKKIGTHVFSFEGIPFYSVKRVSNSIPGIKTRVLSSRTTIRISTIEQTLLDTLHYPYHCGGAEVVFEAWRNRIDNIDDDLLLDYLEKIQIPPLTRRVGAILEMLRHSPSIALKSFLSKSREGIFSLPEVSTIPLLRGINFPQINHNWNVLVP